jgi:hypothetical protein
LGAVLTAPLPGYAETQGSERREDRRDDREAGRDAKQECKDANGKRIDCRQEKRDVKHGEGGAAPAVDAAPK